MKEMELSRGSVVLPEEERGEGFRVFRPEELRLVLAPTTADRLTRDLLDSWPDYECDECGLDLITVGISGSQELVFCFTAGVDEPRRLIVDSREEILERLRNGGNEALNPIIKDYGLRLRVGCEFHFINRGGGALVTLSDQVDFSSFEPEDFLYLPLATAEIVAEQDWALDPEIKKRLGLSLNLFTFIKRKGTTKPVLRPAISCGFERRILEVLAEEGLVTARRLISRVWEVDNHAKRDIFISRISILRPKLACLGLGIEFSEGDYFFSLLNLWPEETVFRSF